MLVPAVVDDSSGYRHYEPAQLAQAEIVRLLRRAGVAVSDIGRFVASPVDRTPLSADGHERRARISESHRAV